MSIVIFLTSGVWEAVGVAAKVIIGGYLHSSGISTFFDVSGIKDIIDIFCHWKRGRYFAIGPGILRKQLGLLLC